MKPVPFKCTDSLSLAFLVYLMLSGCASGQNTTAFEGSGISTTTVQTTPWVTTTVAVNGNTTEIHSTATTATTTTTTVLPTTPVEEIFCNEETLVYPNNASVQINVTFPRTGAGFTTSSLDTCGEGTANSGKPYGTRQCSIDGIWMDPLWLSSCDTNLQDLASTPIENDEQRQQVATDVVTLTADTEELTVTDITSSAEALTAITNTTSLSQNTSDLVVEAVGNLLSVPLSDLKSSNTAQQLLDTLDDVVVALNLSDGTKEFTSVSSTVGVSVLDTRDITEGSVGFAASAVANQSNGFRSDQFRTLTNTIPDSFAAIIVVPFEAISKGNRTGFFGFLNDNVFQASESTKTEKDECRLPDEATLNSPIVVSATIPGVAIKDLQEDQVNITFQGLSDHENVTTNNTFCSFWDDTNSFWSTRGCETVRADNSTAECLCDHLTNFATLFSKEEIPNKINHALDIVTAVGSSVSIVACLLTIVCIIFLWRRRNLPTQVRTFALLASLSLALLLLNVFLIASMFDSVKNSPGACRAMAILIHYSLLSALCWMMIEALYLNIAVTQPIYFKMKLRSTRVYICSTLWGWLAPAVFVAITAGVELEVYNEKKQCWIDSSYMTYLVIIPAAVILGFNLLSYLSVIVIVICRKRPGRANVANARKRNIVLSISLFVVFGLTWVFGFIIFAMGSSEALFPLYCVFTVLNSLQGLFVFLLFVVRNQAMRNSLIREITKLSSTSVMTTQAVQPKYRRRGSFNKYSNTTESSHPRRRATP